MARQGIINKNLPDTPGVYFFLGSNKKILYIGRATSLRSRVRSYFTSNLAEKRSPLIGKLPAEAVAIDFRATDSVLEALLLEADLIKKFQPRFNTDEKDDKSSNCVVITREDFPRVLLVRQHELGRSTIQDSRFKVKATYGPFPNGLQLREAMKIVRRIFPYRDSKCVPCAEQQKRGENHSNILKNVRMCKPCFNRQIGLCPGVCTGEISKEEYARTIRHIRLFFSGRKGQILKDLRREMKMAAKAQSFERAGELKKTIFALEHIQDMSLLKRGQERSDVLENIRTWRIEAYDIAHISGTDVVGVMTVVENDLPQKSEYRKFKIRGGFGNNDIASLREVVERRLNHSEWPLPQLIVADGGAAQKETIESVLKERNLAIPVVAVTKNIKHRPERIQGDEALAKRHERAILLANSEAHRFAITFHRARRSKGFI